ncbi:MAG TPA: anti-sigma factor [Candidatus Paenibacillus intestinavium]|nr:anti-sigma factor [Candidatus Paenibacillus intestinavium]
MTQWNSKLERKILLKSRFTLTLTIARILLILYIVFALWNTAIYLILDRNKYAEENQYFTQLAVEWLVPNVKGSYVIHDEKISNFGTQTYSYPLLKRVGHEDIVIGEAEVTKRLFSSLSTVEYSFSNQQSNEGLQFSLPEDPRNSQKLTGNADSNVWDTLEMLPEGTVGELAFSTTSFMDAAQLLDLLKDYNIETVWMPLYTGEFVDYEPSGYGSGRRSLMVGGAIGLTGGFRAADNYSSMMWGVIVSTESLVESQQRMLANMEKLLDKPEKYYRQVLGLDHLPEKYKYLKETGFTVYGAVVTGPVKELLKLQDETFIQGEQLGEVELWNWDLSR